MLVRKENKIIRQEKMNRVKDAFDGYGDEQILENFVKPLYNELKKIVPKGMEPDLEYDLTGCSCNLDFRSLGQKIKEFGNILSIKGWDGNIAPIANVVWNRKINNYGSDYAVQVYSPKGAYNKSANLKTAISMVRDAYKAFIEKMDKEIKK